MQYRCENWGLEFPQPVGGKVRTYTWSNFLTTLRSEAPPCITAVHLRCSSRALSDSVDWSWCIKGTQTNVTSIHRVYPMGPPRIYHCHHVNCCTSGSGTEVIMALSYSISLSMRWRPWSDTAPPPPQHTHTLPGQSWASEPSQLWSSRCLLFINCQFSGLMLQQHKPG